MARVPLLRNIEGLPRKQASRQGQVRIWQMSRILVRVHPGAVDLRVKTRDIPSARVMKSIRYREVEKAHLGNNIVDKIG